MVDGQCGPTLPMKPLIPIVLAVGSLGCPDFRRGNDFVLPEGFEGWVIVELENSGCPELPVVDGRFVVEVPQDGEVCTATLLEEGLGIDNHYIGPDRSVLVDKRDHPGRRIWGTSTVSLWMMGDKERIHIKFFVGSEEEFKERAGEHR